MRWSIALMLLIAFMLLVGTGCSSKDPEPQKVDVKSRLKGVKPEEAK